MEKYLFGTQFKTQYSGICTIIKYINSMEVYVMFEDGTVTKCNAGNLSAGRVGNPNRHRVFGVAVNDIGNSTQTKIYKIWHSMVRRCYSSIYQGSKSYVDVGMQESWLHFSKFKRDIENLQFFDFCEKHNYEFDKDILSDGSKMYKLETVSFVPREVNSVIIKDIRFGKYKGYYINNDGYFSPSTKGVVDSHRKSMGFKTSYKTPEEALYVYKECKKVQLKDLAEKYKGKIDERVYNKLINYDFNVEQ